MAAIEKSTGAGIMVSLEDVETVLHAAYITDHVKAGVLSALRTQALERAARENRAARNESFFQMIRLYDDTLDAHPDLQKTLHDLGDHAVKTLESVAALPEAARKPIDNAGAFAAATIYAYQRAETGGSGLSAGDTELMERAGVPVRTLVPSFAAGIQQARGIQTDSAEARQLFRITKFDDLAPWLSEGLGQDEWRHITWAPMQQLSQAARNS